MARKNLTDITIDNLKPGLKPYEISDTKSALRVAVFPSGVKSFICRYRFGGRQRKLTLQSGLSLAAARVAAADAMHQLQQGRDPAVAKQDTRAKAKAAAADTLQAICTEYLAREGKKIRTEKLRTRNLKNHVYPVLGSRPITKIVRSDLVRLFDKIEDGAGPFAADMVRAILGRIFHWHEGRTDDFRSPLSRAVERRVKKEDRVRKRKWEDDELRRVWLAANADSGIFATLVKLLLLTAARREEVAGLMWSEIQGDVWTLPAARSKSGRVIIRPLSKDALAIIEAQPRIEGCPFVFSTNGKGSFCGWSYAKRNFDKACSLQSWRLHDLRKAARTLMGRAHIRPDVAKLCLGHAVGGMDEVYDGHDYLDQMRHAVEALSGLIDRIAYPTDNVRKLRG